MFIIFGRVGFMKRGLIGLCISILISGSCGGGPEGYQEYDSVAVGIASIVPTKLESDVIVKKDFDGDGLCEGISFQDDTIVVTLKSLAITPAEGNFWTSPVVIDKYKLTFINASSTNKCEYSESCRALFSKPIERFVSSSVEPGETIYLTLSVIPIDWKNSVLMNYCMTPSDSCVYNVLLEIHAVEAFSGKSKWLKATLTVQIADYVKSNSVVVDSNGNIKESSERDDDCIFMPGG